LKERQLAQNLRWDRPKAYLDDILFRVQQDDSPWDGGDDYFTLYKDDEHFFAGRPSFKAERIFELGMWDGGSVVFWQEFFSPLKHVAIDLADRADSPYFDKYIRSHGREGRVRTFRSTNQGDASRLRKLLSTEFDGPLDLVLDDASYFYGRRGGASKFCSPLCARAAYTSSRIGRGRTGPSTGICSQTKSL
jgi:hypothetical protein